MKAKLQSIFVSQHNSQQIASLTDDIPSASFSFSKSENGEQDEELLEADSTSLLLLPLSSVAVVVVLLPPEKRDYFSTRVLPGW